MRCAPIARIRGLTKRLAEVRGLPWVAPGYMLSPAKGAAIQRQNAQTSVSRFRPGVFELTWNDRES